MQMAGIPLKVQGKEGKISAALMTSVPLQRAYTLVVDVVNINDDTQEEPIQRVTHSGIILPGAEWHTLAHSGLTGESFVLLLSSAVQF